MATICAGDQHGGMPSLEAMKGAALTGSLPDFDLDFEEKAMKITEDDMNYKTKQVRDLSLLRPPHLHGTALVLIWRFALEIHRMDSTLGGLAEHWSHLWGHRYQSPIRLQLDIHFSSILGRLSRGSVHHHLVVDSDCNAQVLFHCSGCR